MVSQLSAWVEDPRYSSAALRRVLRIHPRGRGCHTLVDLLREVEVGELALEFVGGAVAGFGLFRCLGRRRELR